MLRVVAHNSAAAARQYYADGLKREDYYAEGQEVAGKWYGKAAERLGVSGDVKKEQFAALAENRHPVTGERLTPRNRADRRVGYDLNFHAPKSLSVLYALTQDKKVLHAFRQAVSDTMHELEAMAETRVRKGRAQGNRVTGNLAWAEFVHFTSRPVGGVPDPHLHVHCFTFNATFDGVEQRWKAAEFAAIKKAAPYAEAAFHSRLTESLAKLGYGIERKKNGWEVRGMPASVIAKFSRRTAQIEALAEKLGITDPKAKDALGAQSREGKRKGFTFPELLGEWGKRLTPEEKAQLSKVCYGKGEHQTIQLTPAAAVDFAIAKLFERQSVASRDQIIAEALRHAYGHAAPASIKAEFERRGLIGRKIGDEHICTTLDVLAEEVALINFVRIGRNSAARLGGRSLPSLSPKLSDEQVAAVRHILTSRDQVIAIRGAAGVGKTTLMKEAVAAIEKRGPRVFAFAPSAAASRQTLREEGFAGADTVAQLLCNPKLQQQVKGNVIWIDEAGLLGVRDLWRLMEIAGTSTRVILTGDASQHAPVARGDAFRLLGRYAGLRVAEVTQIRRQELEDYRRAIEALSKGDLRTAFRRLEKLGAFVEMQDDDARYQQLAADYMAIGGRKQEFPLVVSPTHVEGAEVTAAIRLARREAGQLGKDRFFPQFHSLQWTEAERMLPENYREGLLVQFHQNAKGFGRGELLRVVQARESGTLEVRGEKGNTRILDLKLAARFTVYEERQIALAEGDVVRITHNGKSENGKRLNNGNVFTIKEFTKQGRLVLSNGAKLKANHGHLAYGYCQTSHSSQSKSVRHVLVAQSANSMLAASREQFYVSCSRGKQTIRIYTDSRQELQAAVGNSSSRVAGVELANLTEQDIASFMQQELGARQWRDAVASRRGFDQSKTFVQNLVEQRKTDISIKKNDAMSWKGYVEMRRNAVTADGKSRSKGHPSVPQKRGFTEKGKSMPKISQHSKELVERSRTQTEAKKAEPKPQPEPKKSRFQRAHEGAAEHFKKLAGKVTGRKPEAHQSATPQQKPPTERTIRLGRVEVKITKGSMQKEAAGHSKRQQVAETQAKAKQQTKQQTKAPVQPAPRRR